MNDPATNQAPEVRNVHFSVDAGVPRYWHGGRAGVTRFFDNLSISFPAGERFFIRSVRHYRERVTDPDLLAAVRLFCTQEGVHSREHDRYNAHLAAQGVRVADLEGRIDRLLARVEARTAHRWQLGVTCALEHFTALMAQGLLGDPRTLENAHPVMQEIWRWHAAEENEHRAVAFDVYAATGGTYRVRAVAMVLTTVIFWTKVIEHQVRLMAADGTLFSLREWADLLRALFVSPGTLRRMVPDYLRYFRRDFHPSQIEAGALLADWRRAFAAAADTGTYRRAA
jgi:predicted metal-dependent hydrolase